jgi:hypothetical protein
MGLGKYRAWSGCAYIESENRGLTGGWGSVIKKAMNIRLRYKAGKLFTVLMKDLLKYDSQLMFLRYCI